MTRPSWNEYFMRFAILAATRSTCIRKSGRHVGAVIVRDKQLLSTGYNGAPKGVRHCAETGCLRDQQNVKSGTCHEVCRGTHAEQNAIVQAAYQGTSLRGSTLYTTLTPCSICTKMIINAGIQHVYYLDVYDDPLGLEMMIEAGVVIEQLKLDED